MSTLVVQNPHYKCDWETADYTWLTKDYYYCYYYTEIIIIIILCVLQLYSSPTKST